MSERASRLGRGLGAIALCAMLGACASGTVVLLPQKDGHASAVSVRQGDKEIVLDQPYAAASSTPLGPRAFASSRQKVDEQFGDALAAQPSRPSTFTLYFELGTDTFTEESKRLLEQILAEIAKRPVPDVVVIGHTDTVGTDQFNDALGQQRADAVRAILIRLGIAAEDVHAISRGKRELAVPTGDGVAEPRNRRVVIEVR
ncbi:MAG TPA: OmpA family protein [Casimicrobiaceae bacterium]|nr:OmpA family protein [Casimicrobiaceae bacterium]